MAFSNRIELTYARISRILTGTLLHSPGVERERAVALTSISLTLVVDWAPVVQSKNDDDDDDVHALLFLYIPR